MRDLASGRDRPAAGFPRGQAARKTNALPVEATLSDAYHGQTAAPLFLFAHFQRTTAMRSPDCLLRRSWIWSGVAVIVWSAEVFAQAEVADPVEALAVQVRRAHRELQLGGA